MDQNADSEIKYQSNNFDYFIKLEVFRYTLLDVLQLLLRYNRKIYFREPVMVGGGLKLGLLALKIIQRGA